MNPGWRSLLFVAADDATRLAKVAGRGADAVILDLEDAVPADRKDGARTGIADVAARLSEEGCEIVVRINAEWRTAFADVAAVALPSVAAIMVPKVESGSRLAVLAEIAAETAEAAGLDNPPGLIALIESPAGLAELDRIAAVPGVIGLALGSEDFSLSLGVPPSPTALDLPCRLIALAAARHGLMALGLPVSIATIADLAAWREGVQVARATGMTGALCIHPNQIGPVNEGFAPNGAEVAAARQVLDAWHAAGSASVIQLDGRMIDRPVVLAAERVMARARLGEEIGR